MWTITGQNYGVGFANLAPFVSSQLLLAKYSLTPSRNGNVRSWNAGFVAETGWVRVELSTADDQDGFGEFHFAVRSLGTQDAAQACPAHGPIELIGSGILEAET